MTEKNKDGCAAFENSAIPSSGQKILVSVQIVYSLFGQVYPGFLDMPLQETDVDEKGA